jgi:RNA polymerase sigma factor (sigma-70 family)
MAVMGEATTRQGPMTDQDQRISDAIDRNRLRLRNFIRRHVADPRDAEDILQDVLYELVEAYRMMNPVEQVTAWLYRVARNRITDLFRSRRREAQPFGSAAAGLESEDVRWEELLPSRDAGPEAAFARSILVEALEDALEELPPEQREVFVAHEIEGSSFKEIAEKTGVGVNTLLSRKHHAVLHLRRRLQAIYDDFMK